MGRGGVDLGCGAVGAGGCNVGNDVSGKSASSCHNICACTASVRRPRSPCAQSACSFPAPLLLSSLRPAPLPRRLKRIQDLVPPDVEAALGKLPRDVSPECVALLRRILCIPPAGRPTLSDIMGDPWFKQFLPDLSKLAVAQPREQQGVAEITRIVQVCVCVPQTLGGAGLGGWPWLIGVPWWCGCPAGWLLFLHGNPVLQQPTLYTPARRRSAPLLHLLLPHPAGSAQAVPAAAADARRVCGGGD